MVKKLLKMNVMISSIYLLLVKDINKHLSTEIVGSSLLSFPILDQRELFTHFCHWQSNYELIPFFSLLILLEANPHLLEYLMLKHQSY
jgi:hypothetical protein